MDAKPQIPPKRVGVFANVEKRGAKKLVRDLVGRFEKAGMPVILDGKTAEFAGFNPPETVENLKDLSAAVDIIVALGGDGTMLGMVREIGEEPKPVAGINTGTLGFLTADVGNETSKFVKAICKGDFAVGHRALIQAERHGADGRILSLVGLNEAVVSRGNISRIIHLETYVNGSFLNRFHADGVIVATPTGSTAYSLSAGGPIVSPEAGVLVITPICPHALSNRSLIVDDSVVIEMRRETRAEEVVMTVDGQQMIEIGDGGTVKIQRARYNLPIISMPGHRFYEVIQHKLRWHGSAIFEKIKDEG
ncbi:NAD(+)/NADH kinase [soil metagenome]